MTMKKWDVFISHASEDKDADATPLAIELIKAGLNVWLDTIELNLGYSLREKIDEGLTHSRFGVVIFSPAFFAKKWTSAELNGLFAREIIETGVILPVWHDVDQKMLLAYSPILADRIAVETRHGLRKVTVSILNAIRSSPGNEDFPRTTLGRFNELIDGDCGVLRLRDFLSHHYEVIEHAVGASRSLTNTTHLLPELGGVQPDFLVAEHHSTFGNEILHIVCLGPISTIAVAKNGQPQGELAVAINRLLRGYHWLRQEAPAHGRITATVAYGRRAEVSEAKKEEFLQLYRRLEREFARIDDSPRPNHDNVQLRTYDWLIEAAAMSLMDSDRSWRRRWSSLIEGGKFKFR